MSLICHKAVFQLFGDGVNLKQVLLQLYITCSRTWNDRYHNTSHCPGTGLSVMGMISPLFVRLMYISVRDRIELYGLRYPVRCTTFEAEKREVMHPFSGSSIIRMSFPIWSYIIDRSHLLMLKVSLKFCITKAPVKQIFHKSFLYHTY